MAIQMKQIAPVIAGSAVPYDLLFVMSVMQVIATLSGDMPHRPGKTVRYVTVVYFL